MRAAAASRPRHRTSISPLRGPIAIPDVALPSSSGVAQGIGLLSERVHMLFNVIVMAIDRPPTAAYAFLRLALQ